jgi:hypothetical protein
MKEITIRIEQDLARCKELWEIFSPKRTLWDIWGVAICFFDYSIHSPYFVVIVKDGKDVGLLPLWHDSSLDRHLIFGGEYMEDTGFWLDVSFWSMLFKVLPENTVLYTVEEKSVQRVCSLFPDLQKRFSPEEFHYTLDLEKYDYQINTFLATFSRKHRKNFLYDITQFKKKGYVIELSSGLCEFEAFIEFNLNRFKEDSDFTDASVVRSMKKFLLYLQEQEMLQTILISKNNTICGVEFAAIFKETYYILNGGYAKDIPNIGKVLIMEHLENAQRLKMNKIDLLCGEGGWKDLWNFNKVQYYTFRKTSLTHNLPAFEETDPEGAKK